MLYGLRNVGVSVQEREILLQQVEQAYKLQGEAEKDADTALSHLEGFINEQEQLVGTL